MRRCVLVIALVAVLAAPAAADAKRLVRYDVGGGLAGRSATLIVDRSGSARQSGTRSATERFMVSAKQLSALKRELSAARFSSLKHRYQPDYPVLDGITQVVTYKGHAVSVSSGAEVPKRLRRVLSRLSRLMRA
jgi:hypothetical protein